MAKFTTQQPVAGFTDEVSTPQQVSLHPSDGHHSTANRLPVVKALLEAITRIAPSNLGVLIVGEEGTEKEFIARMLHQRSGRGNFPMITVDCYEDIHQRSSLSRRIFGAETNDYGITETESGALEQAYGGTLFLKNIDPLPQHFQARLAQAIEHHHYRRVGGNADLVTNVRVVASVTRRISSAVDNNIEPEIIGRICPLIINLPPLRERRLDIQYFIEQYITEYRSSESSCTARGITQDALQMCQIYDWPGNVAELRSVLRRAMENCTEDFLKRHHFPAYLQSMANLSTIEPLPYTSLSK